MKLSLQRIAHFLLAITLFFYILWVAQSVIIPLAFAILLAFMLDPLVKFWEKIGLNRLIAIIFSFLIMIVIALMVMFLLFSQIMNIVAHSESIKISTDQLSDLYVWIEAHFHISQAKSQAWLKENIVALSDDVANYFGMLLASSTAFLANLIVVLTYCFLILLYRTAFKNYLLSQFYRDKKDHVHEVLVEMQQVAQKYIYGLGLVILILGTLNTLGLWAIGIDYPYFWGFFAAFMTIIPYIGTFIGAILPIFYSIITSTSAWQPLSVMLMFLIVQQLEGNFITPKVVGSSVKINPLAALIAMFIGWSLWGVAGVIMALPFIAIFKVMCDNIDFLNPIGKLLSSNIHRHETIFFEKYEGEEYSWGKFFKLEKKEKER
ncbi:MAG: AI-2E family transporter [Chitinophagales bacterium]